MSKSWYIDRISFCYIFRFIFRAFFFLSLSISASLSLSLFFNDVNDASSKCIWLMVQCAISNVNKCMDPSSRNINKQKHQQQQKKPNFFYAKHHQISFCSFIYPSNVYYWISTNIHVWQIAMRKDFISSMGE